MKKKDSGTARTKRKYRNNLYIAHRYVLYNYWWQFLKIAYEEKRKINAKKYEDWGKLDEIFSQSFKTWWEKNWKRLFAEKTAKDRTSKFIMTTENAHPDSIKACLEVYKNRDLGDDRTIFEHLEKKYKNMSSITGAGSIDTKEMNRTMKRYKKQAETILDNVCDCKFP